MRSAKNVAATLVGLMMATGVAQAGDVHLVQTVNVGGQAMETEIWMSGKKLKTSVKTPMGNMDVIMDLDSGNMYTLMAAQKAYIEMPLEATKRMAAAMQKNAPSGEIKVEKTGKTQTINGWKCAEYKITQEGGIDLSIWVTKDLDIDAKEFMELSKELQSQDPVARALDPSVIDGFPIRTEGSVMQGGQKMDFVSEVKSADSKPIPASIFAIPSDYKKMDMGNPFGGAPPK